MITPSDEKNRGPIVPEKPDVDREDELPEAAPPESAALTAEGQFLEQLRRGNADAGHQFVRDYYPGIYRYLLSLTARPDLAEDLTQETFFQAWRHLDQFQGLAPLGAWLYRIARREFLRALRSRRAQVSLDVLGGAAGLQSAAWAEAVELRVVLHRLPREEREVLLLHYLEGYTCREIARIVHAPVGTVKQRLLTGRSRLQHELGEGDLAYLNEPSVPMRQWAWLPLDQMRALETRWRLAGGALPPKENAMERREFLRHAAVGAAGLMLPQAEKEVIDGRLTRKVTLAFKGTALSDLCEHLRTETGVYVSAGPSVADEKVTLFCKQMPLREVMRQLSRPFGYAWVRSRKEGGEYRYELVQDLRSQLLEEELRNRDRNAALLALDAEMQRYQKYLGLSPDEARARAQTASPEEKKLLERYAGAGWPPAHLYFQLSSNDLNQLRAGKSLVYSAEQCQPWHDRPLPPELWRGTLQCQRRYIVERDGRFDLPDVDKRDGSEGVLPTQIPAARAMARVSLEQSELGQFTFRGSAGCFISPSVQPSGSFYMFVGDENLAVGISPSVLNPRNEESNAKLSQDPSLRTPVTLEPQASCAAEDGPRVTTADVLEAIHRATGRPIVADFYTRLHPLPEATVQNSPLFDAVNRLADRMHLRWQKEGEWLRFRSASYFHDRLKEVPNRLLTHWAASRQQHGVLTLDDLIEIAQLTDAQLDAASMAEGAELCYGLAEWKLPRDSGLREQLHYLAEFTPDQRREMQTRNGLAFTRMTVKQQQQFVTLSWATVSLEEFAGWTLRVQYTLPGEFEWVQPGWRKHVPSRVRERTPLAALQAARRLEPEVNESQIVPTRRDLAICYAPAGDNPPQARVVHCGYNRFDP
jgi:RNA polymerase sigma-70 factor (ECF subfamily)